MYYKQIKGKIKKISEEDLWKEMLAKHPTFEGFPCDGVWLVQRKPYCKSAQCILQVGEIPSLYPFANMMMSEDDLIKFFNNFHDNHKQGYSLHDFAHNLFQFLSQLNLDLELNAKLIKQTIKEQ